MAYIYRHIRLDKNEPFYIGISNSGCDYKRAYSVKDRNEIWRRIVSKSDYKVDIILDNLDIFDAKEKEKEFILLYGRIDIKNGTLANMTDGGDGILNINENSLLRKKLSKAAIGKKMSDEAKEKMSKHQKVPILQYTLSGHLVKEWESITSTSVKFKSNSNIVRCLKGRFEQAYGFKWKYKDQNHKSIGRKIPKKEAARNMGSSRYRIIIDTETGIFYKSALELSRVCGINESTLRLWMDNGKITRYITTKNKII